MEQYKLSQYQELLRNDWVDSEQYAIMGEKTTVCLLKLVNGFEVIGTSACVDPADFALKTGKHFALVDALNKLDEYVAFYRQTQF